MIKNYQLYEGNDLMQVLDKVDSDGLQTSITVAEWRTHLAAVLEVMGLCPSFGDISAIHFLESIQSSAQRDLKLSV